MNNGQMDRGNENPTQHLPWWLRKTMKKLRLVGTGIWTRDLPNASLVCYHGATSLGNIAVWAGIEPVTLEPIGKHITNVPSRPFLSFVYTPSQQITSPRSNHYTAFCYVTMQLGMLLLYSMVYIWSCGGWSMNRQGKGEVVKLPIQCKKDCKYSYNVAWVTHASTVRTNNIRLENNFRHTRTEFYSIFQFSILIVRILWFLYCIFYTIKTQRLQNCSILIY